MSSGHFEIKKAKNGQFYFNLKASNGEIVLTSEMHASRSSAEIGVQNVKFNAGKIERYEIKESQGGYYFVLKNDKNIIIGIGDRFTSKDNAKQAINNLSNMFDKSDENIKIKPKVAGAVTTFILTLQDLVQDKDHIYYFRGHSNFEYDALPSVYREGKWVEGEDKLFRELMLRCPNDFNSSMTAFQCLVKMQHYSLPTRLLDITSNALVALYFATEKNKDVDKDKDGEVIIFKIPKKDIKYYDDTQVSLLSNISKMTSDFKLSKDNYGRYYEDDSYNKIIHEVKKEGGYIKSFSPNEINSVLCVKPQMDNPRIIRQDGAFLLFGINEDKKRQAVLNDAFKPEDMYQSIKISKEGKSKIRMSLEDLGISGSTIYPEIEHVANYLKGKFIE